ncbi:MAG: acyltransferase [Opitutales bacterium]|nr:acyltransferase [Opitutales bacterium]
MTEAPPATATPGAGSVPVTARNFNLDVVRAAAISMVVLAHLVVLSPVRRPLALTLSWIGQFGVDLFFVLSGWLIGGLFWKEWRRRGTVHWPRFFLRRALRTVPPYLVALPLAWLGVRLFAPERALFDWGYLVFLQNYYHKIPFFSVSWSLCVEEHFYLLLPALVLLTPRGRYFPHLLFGSLVLVSPLCRTWLETTQTIGDFNQSVLATHLRLEGLVLGFWAAYCQACRPEIWARLARSFPLLIGPALAYVMLTPLVPSRPFYEWGLTVLAAAFLILVGLAAESPAWRVPAAAGVRRLAAMSYSIYLTHSLMIHAARALALRIAGWAEYVYWPLALTAILVAGYVFSRLVETTSLQLRERLLPATA